jgi:LemA protein
MKKGMLIALSVVGVIVILAVIIIMWAVGIRNNVVRLEEKVNEGWSQVETQYQRRADLIPNLVNTVKGYADFERGVLTDVTEARAKVGQLNISPEILNNPALFEQFQAAQGELGGAISRLLVTVENYPVLKANENFLQLQAQLEGTENRIAVARTRFNQEIQAFNSYIKVFPNAIIANLFGFNEKQYFKSTPGSENTPKVEF